MQETTDVSLKRRLKNFSFIFQWSLASGSMEEEMGKNSSFNVLFLEGGVALECTIRPVKEQHALLKKEQRTLPV